MDKRYQVFVSSTYTDLKEERQLVTQTLMKMDCIPAGMELFPASDEDQFEFIKRVIDDCDYYLLIIGGRYGSITSEGISYTEKEYDYAVKKGLKVVALLHKNPDDIPSGKSESTPEAKERLTAFRDKVSQGRLVDFWSDANGLPGQVALSMMNAIKTFPMVGWIRADKVASEDLLSEVNILRKENDNLKQQLAAIDKSPPVSENLASLGDEFVVSGLFFNYDDGFAREYEWKRTITWRELFKRISPYLMDGAEDQRIKELIAKNLAPSYADSVFTHVDDQDFQTIKLQFQAQKLVEVQKSEAIKGSYFLYWSLTPSGTALAFDLRTVKKGPPSVASEVD